MSSLEEKQISSEQLVDGKLLQVYRDEVELPDGNTSIREWIAHPGAAAVVPVFENGDTLMVKQFRYPARRVFLEVPAGKLEDTSDDPEKLAAEELEEETGWRAERFTRIGSGFPCIGYSDEVIYFYLAEGLEEGNADLDDGEFLEVVRLPLTEAIERAQQGDLMDMKTVTALCYAANYLRDRGRVDAKVR